jgi:hypothetical protein
MKCAVYVGSFLLSVLLLLQGCMCFDSCGAPSPSLLFEQGSSDCRLEDETESVAVSVVEGVLTFSGRIATPTPCQHLIPSLTLCGNRILVRINAISQPGACPLCLGMVDYEGGIVGLSPGDYHIRLVHEDRTVLELQVAIGG